MVHTFFGIEHKIFQTSRKTLYLASPMFQTTRRRLALWYTTVTAVLLLLFASGFYLYVRTTLIERIDDTLNHVVEVIQRSLVIEPIEFHREGGSLRVNIEASFRDNAATNEDDRIEIEWFNPNGELIWSTLSTSLQIPLNPHSNGETVRVPRLPDEPNLAPEPQIFRQITQAVVLRRQLLGYLRVSHPWFEVTKPTRQLVVDLVLGTSGMVMAVGAIGWFLSGLAMTPVYDSYQRLKQFTADASHELRSPIAVIQTNVQVALADPHPDPIAQQQQLKVIERLTRRLGRLVDDLLFLARQDSGMVQPRWITVRLDNLLQEILEEQQMVAAEKSVTITYEQAVQRRSPPTDERESETWTLQGDRDQLSRLFTNLVSNAVYYTPANGQVRLELQRLQRPPIEGCQITISDTGIGIPPEALPHLFDRFYRVDPARSQTSKAGSGLGLAIAQAIVQNHQGQIHISSTVGQGTIVTVTLPQRLAEMAPST